MKWNEELNKSSLLPLGHKGEAFYWVSFFSIHLWFSISLNYLSASNFSICDAWFLNSDSLYITFSIPILQLIDSLLPNFDPFWDSDFSGMCWEFGVFRFFLCVQKRIWDLKKLKLLDVGFSSRQVLSC